MTNRIHHEPAHSQWGAGIPRVSLAPPEAEIEREPSGAHSFPFALQRRSSGIAMSAAAAALVALGSFLSRQIPVTPALSTQLVLISVLCFTTAGWASMVAFRDLFGALTINGEGIHASPKLMGFSILWDDLESWDIKDYAACPLSAPGMMFRRSGQIVPETLRCGVLSDHDVERVRQLLRLRAAASEQPKAASEVG